MNIINLTQHKATAEQAVLFDPQENPDSKFASRVRELLTFEELPTQQEIRQRAERLADMAEFMSTEGIDAAMIGGAPFLMKPLQEALEKRGMVVLFAFSKRESVETVLPNGEIEKRSAFRHLGFVGPEESQIGGFMEKTMIQTMAGARMK